MLNVIILFTTFIGGICGIAFFVYKTEIFGYSSWEEAVKGLLNCLKTACIQGYYFLTDTVPPEKRMNKWILLSDVEIKELIAEFKRNLYILPRMEGWQIEKNGILRIQISAFDVVSVCKGMTNETYQTIAERIIQKFYFDIRNRPVFLFVESVTNHHLHFAIPLTEEGREILKKENEKRQEKKIAEIPIEPLEEEVDISDYKRVEDDELGDRLGEIHGISAKDSSPDYPAEKDE